MSEKPGASGPPEHAKPAGGEHGGDVLNASFLRNAVSAEILEGLGVDEGAGPKASPQPKPRPAPDSGRGDTSMLELMAKAQVAWLSSGARYFGELTELFGRRGASMTDLVRMADGGLSDTEKLQLLDEARGYLREVGDISLREAQALKNDLLELEAALRKTQEVATEKAMRQGRPTK